MPSHRGYSALEVKNPHNHSPSPGPSARAENSTTPAMKASLSAATLHQNGHVNNAINALNEIDKSQEDKQGNLASINTHDLISQADR